MTSNDKISAGLRARVAMQKLDFRHTHSLGQNFILDDMMISALLDSAEVTKADNVLEIGPGAGVMTSALAQRSKHVLAIEIDRELEGVLSYVLEPHENVDVVYGDAMHVNLKALTDEAFSGEPFRVVANLPYYITADIIQKLLLAKLPLESICVMVQREAAERIMSHPGEKQWCAMAATIQFFGMPESLLEVPPQAFIPAPHVMSNFIRIQIYKERPVQPVNESTFLRLIAAAFAMRRKTLANNLKAMFSLNQKQAIDLLVAAGLSEKVRGEALSLKQLAYLSDRLGEIL